MARSICTMGPMEVTPVWKKCSTCKKPITFGGKYFVCSVSTCSGQRTGYVFCGMTCFEGHLPGARHRDAGAIEKIAPMTVDSATPSDLAPVRRIVSAGAAPTPGLGSNKMPREVLIVASRLKEYIQARADFNTSASVMDFLSDYVRILCDRAIDNARTEGRKTVMDRDFEFVKDLKG